MSKQDLQKLMLVIAAVSLLISALSVLMDPEVREVEGKEDYECVYGYPVVFITHDIPRDGTPLKGLSPWLFNVTGSRLSPMAFLINTLLIYTALTLLVTLARLGYAYFRKKRRKRFR